MPDKTKDKIVIYQVFTRLFGNENRECVHSGSIRQNGCGKFSNFNINALSAISRNAVRSASAIARAVSVAVSRGTKAKTRFGRPGPSRFAGKTSSAPSGNTLSTVSVNFDNKSDPAHRSCAVSACAMKPCTGPN